MQPSSASWQSRLTDTLTTAVNDSAAMPGLIIGVWPDGQEPYVRGFGVRDTANQEPMTADLWVRVGSLTKSFTVTALLQLVDQRKVELDDPIGKYVPDVPNGDAITLRMLAAMRSGLFSYTNVIIPTLAEDPARQWTPAELLALSFQTEPLFPPDAKFDYSNTNTVLLGLVIEQVTGQPLPGYLDEHILRPSGLSKTAFPEDASLPEPYAHGYTLTADGVVVDSTHWNPSWGWAAGQMVSTLEDMRVWADALAGGTLLSADAVRERDRFQPAPQEGDGSLYGLGIELQNGWVGHNGNITGYMTFAYRLPSAGITMVVMFNSSIDLLEVWALMGEITMIITPEHPWPGPPTED